MIVKLNDVRIFFPGNSNKYTEAVREFGNLLGDSIHIQNLQTPESDSIKRSQERIDKATEAISILKDVEPIEDFESKEEILHWSARSPEMVIRNILSAQALHDKILNELNLMIEHKAWYTRWRTAVGKYEAEKLANLGVYMKFYTSDKETLNKIPEDKIVYVQNAGKGLYLVILLSCDNEDKLDDLIEDQPPKFALEYVDKYIIRKKRQLNSSNEVLSALTEKIDLLKAYRTEHEDFLLERNALFGMEQLFDNVPYMKCYVSDAHLKDVKKIANKYSLGISIMSVEGDDEDAPTLLKNPKWVNRVKPVMNFMGLVHGYHELDLSRVFMIFFTFFTGILVGDAGYGLIFLLLSLFAHSKFKFKPSIEFSLVYTLSVSIMVWGILTGTYFGSPEIAELPGLSHLVIDKIASFGGDNIMVQKVMFIIGAVHLTIGHLQKAWHFINSRRAIGQIGWVAIVWSLYIVVCLMVLKIPAPDYTKWMFIGGISAVGLFSHSGGNFFKGIISSLGDLPLSIVNGFSDIISYIRLYAVGLSTVLMAQSFNEMAIGDGLSSVGAYILAIFVLLGGHALNMILAGMAVIVHGVRLNMLEYASHAGVDFSGSQYVPFKFKNKKSNI